VKTAKEVIPAIAQALQNGDLSLHDLNNRKLNVPPQTIRIIEPYRPGNIQLNFLELFPDIMILHQC